MKFYLFASEKVSSAADLPAVKAKTKAALDGLIKLIEADARQRAESE
jgi:phosphoglucomutase